MMTSCFLGGILLLLLSPTALPLPYATCGDCFCVPDDGESCPVDRMPETNFTDVIPFLVSVEHTNPFTLDATCNPHESNECSTNPPQALTEQEGAVCAFRYVYDELSENSCPISYSHESVASLEEAEQEGLAVTHFGACGVCSSAKDLAVYMQEPDLSEVGTQCSYDVLTSLEKGIECFMNAGFSRPCATMWAFDSKNTISNCLTICLQVRNSETLNNLDSPTCPMNDCLQCNEDVNHQVFSRVAGRTRRNSGLLSMIVRPCTQLVELGHRNPCNASDSPSVEPTAPPTPSSEDTSASSCLPVNVLLAQVFGAVLFMYLS